MPDFRSIGSFEQMKMMMLRIMRQNVRFFSNSTRKLGEQKKDPELAFKIRPMRIEEIPQVVELTSPNHFHFPPSTLKFWHAQDPDGIKVAVTESGEIIGSVSNVKNTESLYVSGLFCVHENYRHSDVGKKLIRECFAYPQGKNFVGNAKVERIKPSLTRGAKILESDWISLEYETDTPVNPAILSDELPSGVELLAFQNSLLPAIFEYDYSLAGFNRKHVIEASCNEENSKTLVAMKDGKCIGFGSIKLDNVEYWKIGPLYADDPSVAEVMVKRLVTAMPEAKGFAIVTINTNIFANMILNKLNIPIFSSLYRMYMNEKLQIDTKRVFAHLDIDFTAF